MVITTGLGPQLWYSWVYCIAAKSLHKQLYKSTEVVRQNKSSAKMTWTHMFFKTVVLLLAVPWLLTDKGVSESNKFYGLFTWLTHMAALNPKPLNPKP